MDAGPALQATLMAIDVSKLWRVLNPGLPAPSKLVRFPNPLALGEASEAGNLTRLHSTYFMTCC